MKLKYLFSMAMAGIPIRRMLQRRRGRGRRWPRWCGGGTARRRGIPQHVYQLADDCGREACSGYDDGTPDEYQVNSAKLLVFSGESEAAATLHRVYDLDVSAFTKNDETQITSSANIVQEIQVPPTVGQPAPTFYAMSC